MCVIFISFLLMRVSANESLSSLFITFFPFFLKSGDTFLFRISTKTIITCLVQENDDVLDFFV